jgi:NAD(P)-dependent dehydrogenase (short-subunit alcohol dehydrogenase family)
MNMESLGNAFRALVIGASGGIGNAFVTALQADPACSAVLALHRQSHPPIDFADEDSVAAAAASAASHGPFHLIINAAGLLHSDRFMPEKRLADLHYDQMLETFRANTFGPAMVLRHFTPLLTRERSIMVMLSARVGSIEDNRLGGWYSYRASKAALNMLVKTASIEVRRSRPLAVLVALHPGTVNTSLSQPFDGARIGRPAQDAAGEMLHVIDQLDALQSGGFFAWDGSQLAW